MIFRSPKNPNSHLTVKQRNGVSFPTRKLLERKLIVGRVLDFGSGLGMDGQILRRLGYDVTDYDPHYAPDIPVGQFDTVLCHYVLNVLLPEEQSHVLMAVSELLKPTGRAFFTVRRDIRRSGFRIHREHGCKVYQCNVTLPYQSILQASHCEIYEYRHCNQLSLSSACQFCTPTSSRDLITESATVYAMHDKYPVSPGHALIIPKQHVTDYFELSERAKTACWAVVDRVKSLICARFHPDGFNIGINVGTPAGQTVSHVHIHLIPRYMGDVENPTGGVRGVIPGKQNYFTLDP